MHSLYYEIVEVSVLTNAYVYVHVFILNHMRLMMRLQLATR